MKSGVGPNTCPSNVKCLFTLQKKAISLLCNADRLAHTNAMFKYISILNLSEFVKYKTAIVMLNLFHGILPIQLQRRFSKYSSVHSTRQKKSFVMVQVRTIVAYPELVSRGVSKTRKFKWLVKVGASIYQTPDLKKKSWLGGGGGGFRATKKKPGYATALT